MNTQLIDYSPPHGDYVRYIDQLMQRSQAAAAAHAPHLSEGASPSRTAERKTPLAPPGQVDGPPELAEIMRKVFQRPAGGSYSKSKTTQKALPNGMPVVPVWWAWVALALIVAGVLLPMGIGWIAALAFVLWRASKSASAKKGRKL